MALHGADLNPIVLFFFYSISPQSIFLPESDEMIDLLTKIVPRKERRVTMQEMHTEKHDITSMIEYAQFGTSKDSVQI